MSHFDSPNPAGYILVVLAILALTGHVIADDSAVATQALDASAQPTTQEESAPAPTRKELSQYSKDVLVQLCLSYQHQLQQLKRPTAELQETKRLKQQIAELQQEVDRLEKVVVRLSAPPSTPALAASEATESEPQAPKDGFDPDNYKYKYEPYYRNQHDWIYELGPFRKSKHSRKRMKLRLYFKNETGKHCEFRFVVEALNVTPSTKGDDKVVNVLTTSQQQTRFLRNDETANIDIYLSMEDVADANVFRVSQMQVHALGQ